MKQERYKVGATYQITGPTKLTRKVKYIGKFKYEKDTVLMFRNLRPKKVS
mgnify:CR=1|jgi:hypothetical protein